MDKIDQRLHEQREQLQALKTPEDMDMRLRNALDKLPSRTAKKRPALWKFAAAAIVLSLVVLSSNYNALAYYSKKLLGFDGLFNSTLQELNEQGMGQVINISTQLLDGTELTIDGIMADSNQLILYYTLSNEDGLGETSGSQFRPHNIKGFFTNSRMISGTAMLNEDATELKGMYTFQNVNPFAKTLTLNYWENAPNGQLVDRQLEFSYNPNKAMQSVLKQSIKETVAVDQGSITFNSIQATPTMTLVEGKMKVKNFDRMPIANNEILLIANGKPVEVIGSGYSTSITGRTFELRYDALPQPLHSLELHVSKFVGYEEMNTAIPLTNLDDSPYSLGHDKKLWIDELKTTSEQLEITITTEEDVMLEGVYVQTKQDSIELNTTVNQRLEKELDGKLLKQRTIVFDTLDTPEYLHIKGMHLLKSYDVKVPIKVD